MEAIMPRRLLFVVVITSILALSLFSSCRRKGSSQVRSFDSIAEPIESPGWITFKASARINPKALFKDYAELFQLTSGNEMSITSEDVDDLGMTHLRFQQLYKGIEVENAEFRVRAKERMWPFRRMANLSINSPRPRNNQQ